MFARLFLNELSLAKTANDAVLFSIFRDLQRARKTSVSLARILRCSRLIGEVKTLGGERIIAALSRLPKDERSALLNWLGRQGPFTDEDDPRGDNDLYHLFDFDVTDFGPGEAARRTQRGDETYLISSTHRVDLSFASNHLTVFQGFPEDPIDVVNVRNIIDLAEAIAIADVAIPEPATWEELLQFSREKFSGLLIGKHCDEILSSQTFYPAVARRVIDLFGILDSIVAERDDADALSARGREFVQNHFVGGAAWFTDESDQNKRDFGSEMTFPDPANDTLQVQFFWHAKIKVNQFRAHFEWPIARGNKTMRVAYLGPKISKR